LRLEGRVFKFYFREKFPCTSREFIERTMYSFDEYVKFSPNVAKVDVLSREPLDDGREKVTIKVLAKAVFPAPVRAVFNMGEMEWKEHYIVDFKSLTVDWQVETPVFTEYVDCKGTSKARDIPDGCEMEITGRMQVETPPIKGVPEPVVKAALNIIEPFIGQMVSMNLKKYFKSVRECFEKEKGNQRVKSKLS
jgi:hypothetical protein